MPGHGFTAVLIALVANLSVLATAVVSMFFGGLASAALYLPILAGLPAADHRHLQRLRRALHHREVGIAGPPAAGSEAPDMTEFHEFMVAILRSGTPLVYVTMAGVIAQRAGVWHLGLEGVMIVGACATILGIVLTGSFAAAIVIACVLCVAASILLWCS